MLLDMYESTHYLRQRRKNRITVVGFCQPFPPVPAGEREMKLAAIGMAVVTGAWASGSTSVQMNRVPVCVSAGSFTGVSQAQGLAAEIFKRAGVNVEWHTMTSCPTSPDTIKITFSDRTPRTVRPGAMAYALPYEGTHIVIYYDRVALADPENFPRLLAYVIVHETTHILQRLARHSETGIMKANWDRKDYAQMRMDNLTFTEADLDLIHQGLEARAPTPTPAMVASR